MGAKRGLNLPQAIITPGQNFFEHVLEFIHKLKWVSFSNILLVNGQDANPSKTV